MKITLPLTLCASYAFLPNAVYCQNDKLPNIIFILADDLGYGDLSCYGQLKFQTPNIDRLASQGMLFRQHYTGCTVSAPSRASLMTGLHTGHSPIRGNKGWKPEGEWPMPSSYITLAEMLKAKGYATGAFGKWGLGFIGTEGDPNNQGFDEFFGFNSQTLAHNYYPYYLWHNGEKIVLKENEGFKTGIYSTDTIHSAAINFLKGNRNKPFFLYYATTIPHAELLAKPQYMDMFRGKFDPEKVFNGVDSGKTYRLGPYGSQPESHATFAAMVIELDDYVGDIMDQLKTLGLENNTIILFASDNGPHLEGGGDPDFFNSNGPLRGYKRDLYEGGIRTPFLVRWPGKIKPGSETDHISAFWDIMPTISEITGSKMSSETDGISFLPVLLGKKDQKQHESLYWEFHEQGGKIAVRMGNWKGIRLNADKIPGSAMELYDLSKDIGEAINVAASNPEIVRKIDSIMKKEHIPSKDYPFAYEIKK
jgi:arylsulfatase A